MNRFLAASLVATAAWWLSGSSDGPGVCPHDAFSCFFSDDYHSARVRFREAATHVNATLHQLQVSAEMDLTIDVAVLDTGVGNAAPPTLVHMSGTHGVEGHAGSAIQLALLKEWAAGPPNGVRLVLVHAVNPYGFFCGRRFNEDNADLNRNVLEPGEFDALDHDATRVQLYDEHEWLFNLRAEWTPIIDDVKFVAKAVYGIVAIGMVNVKRAVVAGQYHQPSGLYFGGSRMAKSHELLLPLLNRIASPASSAILIDVHTGLGPRGVDTLIPPLQSKGEDAATSAAAIHAIFAGASPASGEGTATKDELGRDFLIDAPTPDQASGSAAAGYELARGTSDAYTKHIPGWQRALAVTQEFGTLPGPLVLRGMSLERAEWLYRDADPSLSSGCKGSAIGARALRDVFYVRRASWQKKVVRRGSRLVAQAVRALTQDAQRIPRMAT